ncbi:MAG: hypothetical protein ACI4V5_06130, partial [Prevotella sp.]
MDKFIKKVLLLVLCIAASSDALAGQKSTKRSSFDWNPVMDAIIQVESEGNARAVSGNSCGAMQITPILVKECNNILKRQNSKKRYIYLIIGIVILLLAISGATFAYFAFTTTNNNITGSAGTVNLALTVTKVLPETSGTDEILITNFNELADKLNDDCIDSDGEFALCQLYKITLTNNSTGVNVNVSGSVSFNNENAPNLSWIYLSSYSSSTSYTSTALGDTFNTASLSYTTFVDNQLI